MENFLSMRDEYGELGGDFMIRVLGKYKKSEKNFGDLKAGGVRKLVRKRDCRAVGKKLEEVRKAKKKSER
jgi:hypothetical protein